MKNIIGILFILSISVFLISSSRSSEDITQAIISIPNLTSVDVQQNIEQEFLSISGVQSCESSLMTNMLTLHYDDRKLSKNEINRILEKWGCYPDSYTFHKFIQ